MSGSAVTSAHDWHGCRLYPRGAFRSGAPEDLRRHATDLSKAGAKTLVIDVRRTAEGPMENGHAAARAFVKKGTLGIKMGRESLATRETIAARDGDGSIALPITLLITTGTAGAAELFAAALDGNDRASLVGERTLGRAGVQKIVQGFPRAARWLTYAPVLTPAGDPIPRPLVCAGSSSGRTGRRIRRRRSHDRSNPRRGARKDPREIGQSIDDPSRRDLARARRFVLTLANHKRITAAHSTPREALWDTGSRAISLHVFSEAP